MVYDQVCSKSARSWLGRLQGFVFWIGRLYLGQEQWVDFSRNSEQWLDFFLRVKCDMIAAAKASPHLPGLTLGRSHGFLSHICFW